jgi:hypothetical protein
MQRIQTRSGPDTRATSSAGMIRFRFEGYISARRSEDAPVTVPTMGGPARAVKSQKSMAMPFFSQSP